MDNEVSDQNAITVTSLSKSFKLPHEKLSSIKSTVLNFYKRRSYEQQRVLHDISFEVKKGEFFGIVGRNGSGKSTLLKILAGIYSADKGDVIVNGLLTPFIELGVGFNPELTGRENVYLNGALLGFDRREMSKMYDGIVEFAELERFMDQKLKNYSSGMQVRLAFSIAIRAKSDILLIDEVLAVGDAAFQQKCFDVFAKLKKDGTTIILVTHDMGSVLRFCDRAMLIDKGDVIKIGNPHQVADTYLELNYNPAKKDKEMQKSIDKKKKEPAIKNVSISGLEKEEKHRFLPGEKARVCIKFKNNSQKKPLHFGLQIFSENGTYCFGTNSNISGLGAYKSQKENDEVFVDLGLDLVPGTYSVTAALMNESATTVYSYRDQACKFRIIKNTQNDGIALLSVDWQLDKLNKK